MYILLLFVGLYSIHTISCSWSSIFSTFVVFAAISSFTAMATPPPSLLVLCFWIHGLYPVILGGICLVSVRVIMSAWYVSAADCMLPSFPLIPFTFAYIILMFWSWGGGLLFLLVMLLFLPEASFGLRVLSLPASVCVCVRMCASTPSLSAR